MNPIRTNGGTRARAIAAATTAGVYTRANLEIKSSAFDLRELAFSTRSRILSDQAQGILTAVKRRQRPSGAPQAPSSPEPAERPQERPQARETPPQAPQEPPKPIRTKKALTDRFKTRLDERLAENERKQAEKQAEPDMEETWDLSDPADPLNIGMGWGTGGHGLGL